MRDLEKRLFAWIDPAAKKSGFPVTIFASQTAPQPEGNYLVIDIRGMAPASKTEITTYPIASTPEAPMIGEAAITRYNVALNLRGFHTEDARAAMRALQARLAMTEACEEAERQNIALQAFGEQQDRTYLEEDTMRQRIDVAVTVSFTEVVTAPLHTIGHVHTVGEDEREKTIVDEWINEVEVTSAMVFHQERPVTHDGNEVVHIPRANPLAAPPRITFEEVLESTDVDRPVADATQRGKITTNAVVDFDEQVADDIDKAIDIGVIQHRKRRK